MGEAFSIIFGLIWMFVVITIIVNVAKGASKVSKTQQQIRQNLQQPQRMSMPQSSAGRAAGQQSFRSVPGATYGSSYTGSQRAKSDSYRAGGAVDVKTSSVLFEDRRNDWLAQQFREEDAAKRRGMLADLGALHEVECAADELKRSHVKRHNTTGLNKGTFK